MVLGIDVRVLGPLRLTIDGDRQPLTGRPLLLVARLALAAGSPVGPARLAADLWPEGGGSDGAVRVTLTRVRKALGDAVVVRRGGGYLLDGVSCDAVRFEQAVRFARDRSQSIERRLSALDAALDEWSGTAFEGTEAGEWFQSEAHRLEELREQAVDERFELMLLVGRHEQAVAELRGALSRSPTRERRAELLAVALYRSGRQEDALAVIAQVRHDLRERLGLDPGPALRIVEQQVLDHAPELAASPLVFRAERTVEVEARLRAAYALLRAGVFDETGQIIDEAEATATEAGDRRLQGLVLLARARLLMLSGDGDPFPLIDQARLLGRELRDGELLAVAAMVRFGAGVPVDKADGLVEFLEPLALLPSDAPEVLELLCCAAITVLFTDASDAADRLLAEAEKVYERDRSDRSRAILLVTQALSASVHYRPADEVADAAAEAYDLARSTGDATLVTVAAQGALRAGYERGDLAVVDDVLDVLERASRDAMLPFGMVRVALCRSTNAFARGRLDEVPALMAHALDLGTRMRTIATTAALRSQQFLLAREAGFVDVLVAQARDIGATFAMPTVWDAVVALGDDDVAARLAELAPKVPVDDSHGVFIALASEIAAARRDATLGAWCAARLAMLGDRTVMSGLGTVVMGFGEHYAGLASAACDDLDRATEHLHAAAERAEKGGAHLWWAHSTVELADVHRRRGVPAEARAALERVEATDLPAQSARLAARLAQVRDAALA